MSDIHTDAKLPSLKDKIKAQGKEVVTKEEFVATIKKVAKKK